MPTYCYVCSSCGHTFEIIEKITSDPQTICPKCKKTTLQRQVCGKDVIVNKKGNPSEKKKGSCCCSCRCGHSED
ncbi:MAG: zinc ribbon domain-containing protein [Chlamydiota bacterium]